MPVDVKTGWVVPPPPIRGLDHLGVQAPCIALYGQLLPGITNVTDRARYYSFYPWLLWSYERRYPDRTADAFCRVLRRAECLLGLITSYHETVLGEDERNHGAATIGRIKLRAPGAATRNGTVVRLDDYAAFEGDDRYFKNRLGGLGQYYFGPLRDLRILDYVNNDRQQPPGYDRVRGAALAEAFDAVVPSDRFFEVLEDGTVGEPELADLAAFCPCGLKRSNAERDLLLDIFFARTEQWTSDGGLDRRATLALLLDLVDQQPASPEIPLERLLRGAAYSGSMPDGRTWDVCSPWERIRDGWGVYARNEILSVALQGLFWAQLRIVEERGGRLRTTDQAAELLREATIGGLGNDWASLTVNGAVAELEKILPARGDWSAEEHEIRRTWRLEELAARGAAVGEVAKESAILILSLLVRGVRDYPYQEFDLDPGYFAADEIHLVSLRRWSEEWADWPLDQWLTWIGRRWCIERHLHVALRKLRGENRDTFRIRPLDGLFSLVEVPPLAFTSPRVAQAGQILRDLGLLLAKDDWFELSDSGRTTLEECRGGD